MRGVYISDLAVIESIGAVSSPLLDTEAERVAQLADGTPFVWWMLQEGEYTYHMPKVKNAHAALVCLGKHRYVDTLYYAVTEVRDQYEIGGAQSAISPIRRIPKAFWVQAQKIDLPLQLTYLKRRKIRRLAATDNISFASACETFFLNPHLYRGMYALIGNYAIPMTLSKNPDDLVYFFDCFSFTLHKAGFHDHRDIVYRLVHSSQPIGVMLRELIPV